MTSGKAENGGSGTKEKVCVLLICQCVKELSFSENIPYHLSFNKNVHKYVTVVWKSQNFVSS